MKGYRPIPIRGVEPRSFSLMPTIAYSSLNVTFRSRITGELGIRVVQAYNSALLRSYDNVCRFQMLHVRKGPFRCGVVMRCLASRNDVSVC